MFSNQLLGVGTIQEFRGKQSTQTKAGSQTFIPELQAQDDNLGTDCGGGEVDKKQNVIIVASRRRVAFLVKWGVTSTAAEPLQTFASRRPPTCDSLGGMRPVSLVISRISFIAPKGEEREREHCPPTARTTTHVQAA